MSNFFQNFEKKTGVDIGEVVRLANSVKNANFKDEATVRSLIQQIAKVANKPVNKETENQLINTIVNNPDQVNAKTISKMLDQK